MQRYARNQSKRVVENKIVMETNANKTTLFLQLMRKRCFFVGSKLVGSSRFAGPSSKYYSISSKNIWSHFLKNSMAIFAT